MLSMMLGTLTTYLQGHSVR